LGDYEVKKTHILYPSLKYFCEFISEHNFKFNFIFVGLVRGLN